MKFLARRDNLVINPTIGLLCQLESDSKHTQHAKLSLVVLELTEVKILKNREIWQHCNIPAWEEKADGLVSFVQSIATKRGIAAVKANNFLLIGPSGHKNPFARQQSLVSLFTS